MHVKSGDCSFVENNNLTTLNLIKLPPSEYIMPFRSKIQHTSQISSPRPFHQSRVQLFVEHYLDSFTLPLNRFTEMRTYINVISYEISYDLHTALRYSGRELPITLLTIKCFYYLTVIARNPTIIYTKLYV